MKSRRYSICRSTEGRAHPAGSIINLAILSEEGGHVEEGATDCPALRNPLSRQVVDRLDRTQPCPVSRLSGMQKRAMSLVRVRRVYYGSRYEIAATGWGAVYHHDLTRRQLGGWARNEAGQRCSSSVRDSMDFCLDEASSYIRCTVGQELLDVGSDQLNTKISRMGLTRYEATELRLATGVDQAMTRPNLGSISSCVRRQCNVGVVWRRRTRALHGPASAAIRYGSTTRSVTSSISRFPVDYGYTLPTGKLWLASSSTSSAPL